MSEARERPDRDFSPVGVITRLARARTYLDAELRAVFARFGLTAADFTVIITLRRSGAPYTMPQARLMDALGQTSGTVSVRLDRLEHSGRAIDGVPTTSSAGLALLLDDLIRCPAATVTLLRGNDQATAELDLTPAQ